MKMKILVTGGIGYIGSHTVVELINKGYEVVIIDNLCNSDIKILDGIESITGKRPIFGNFDLCKRKKVDDFFKNNPNIEGVIHFAALKAVGESVKYPLEYYHNNLVSLENVLWAMDKYKVFSLVFSSSCTVYGQPEKLPVTENSPMQPATSPYGNTKQIGEQMIKDFVATKTNLNAIALRYFNPIGAHHSGHIGELPTGTPENLVPYITQTAVGIRNELKVFGDNYNTPDGTCIRDYLHVTDLAKAHVDAIKRLTKKRINFKFEAFNIGTGTGVSVLEMIKSFERVSGYKLKYKIVDKRKGDIEKIWADPTFANNELRWKAKSTLDEAMKTAWDWELNLYNEREGKKFNIN